jgi:hypothetical protein
MLQSHLNKYKVSVNSGDHAQVVGNMELGEGTDIYQASTMCKLFVDSISRNFYKT